MNLNTHVTCPKCGLTFLTPIYNWMFNKMWMQCRCGCRPWAEPEDNKKKCEYNETGCGDCTIPVSDRKCENG